MIVVGYARVATGESGLTVSEQADRIHRAARRMGSRVVTIYTDSMHNGPGDGSTRAGLVDLLDSMARWQLVLVTDRSRIDRVFPGLNVMEELEKGCRLWREVGDVKGSEPRPKPKPSREPLPPMEKAQRLLEGRRRAAQRGLHQSGPAPYGYQRDYSLPWRVRKDADEGTPLVICEREAEVVRWAFREYLRGKSFLTLAEELTQQGRLTRRGNKWSRAAIAWLLKNDTYVGRVHFGGVNVRGRHPAIVSQIIFNKVQQRIRAQDKKGRGERKRRVEPEIPA